MTIRCVLPKSGKPKTPSTGRRVPTGSSVWYRERNSKQVSTQLWQVLHELFINYSLFYIWSPIFRGWKVTGQLTDKQFYGQMRPISSLLHNKLNQEAQNLNELPTCIWKHLADLCSKEMSGYTQEQEDFERIDFARKHIKEHAQFWKKFFFRTVQD